MSLSEPVALVRGLGGAPRMGVIVLAQQAVDTYVAGCTRMDERGTARDILLRDLARLRVQEPDLDPFIGAVEGHIDLLHRQLPRRAA